MTAVSAAPLRVDPVEYVVGGSISWFFWVWSAQNFGRSSQRLYRTLDAPTCETVRNAFRDALHFVGSCASTAEWAYKAHLIPLGRFVPLLQGVTYGAMTITSAIDTALDISEFQKINRQLGAAREQLTQERLKQERILNLLCLASDVTIFVWAFLGVTALVTGVAISSSLLLGILAVSCVFWGLSFVYDWHMGEQWVKVDVQKDGNVTRTWALRSPAPSHA